VLTGIAPITPPSVRHPWRYGVLAGYWLILFVVTHLPKSPWPGWAPEPRDTSLHFIAYLLLGGIGWWALAFGRRALAWRAVEWFAVVAVYAACDEILQMVCNRFCSVADLVADLAGATLAIGTVELFRRVRGRD